MLSFAASSGAVKHARVMRPTGTLHRYWDPGGMSDSLDGDWEDLGLAVWGAMPLGGEGGGDLIVVHSSARESERLIAHLHSPRKFSNGIDPPAEPLDLLTAPPRQTIRTWATSRSPRSSTTFSTRQRSNALR